MRCANCYTTLTPQSWHSDACSPECLDWAHETYNMEASEKGWDRLPYNEQDVLIERWFDERTQAVKV